MKMTGEYSYRLDADIVLDADFASIPSFSGTLDGNGHSISNITQPLFTVLDGAEVRDLRLFTPGFTWDGAGQSGESASAGVLAAKALGAISPNGISVTIDGRVASSSARTDAGGLIGWIDGRRASTSIADCSVTLLPGASVFSPMSNNTFCAGGLFGSHSGTHLIGLHSLVEANHVVSTTGEINTRLKFQSAE